VCDLCPIDSKFTILNEMFRLYQDPRISLTLGAAVQTVETTGRVATGVTYLQEGRLQTAKADLIVLGANALFNPHILMRSRLHHPLLGKFLHEQVAVSVVVDLDGVENYQGSTSITGSGYMFYDGSHRSDRAACLVESLNMPYLRAERGKWRQRMIVKFTFEDLPSERNFVAVNNENPALPETVFAGYSDYARRGIAQVPDMTSRLLATLPVERVHGPSEPTSTVFHIQGTTRMGGDPAVSIVDRHLVHHQVRNLIVLGSGAFPTGSPANPTLTLSALSLWSAAHLLGS
jgi:choline dehydrogenase-like flavoprotein